jgi:putative ABC transport system permease protein
VIGADIKRDLFAFDDPLRAQIQIGKEWFTVVGVIEDKQISRGRANVIDIRNLNRDLYIPVTTAEQRFMPDPEEEQRGLSEIAIRVISSDKILEAANIVDSILKRRHNGVKDYELMIPEELLRQSQKTQRIFNIVMSAIAGISLLVGGIGIMNIMLANVTQRTREIGIRRAIGATQNDILGQFLIECLTISLLGGVVGIMVGVALGRLITFYAKWETIISMGAVILSFGVAGGTGVIFGIYPATKAAKLDPIEALRYQ